tara:strand:- start:2119 stop:2601 length:483 start_codon:yes stop_codon:yes gene_type:complete
MKQLMLIGDARHGKDTVAEMLRDSYGFRFIPASWTFAEMYMREMLMYDTTQQCFDDRVNHRKLWGDHIESYNTPDAAALAKMVMGAGSDVYVGTRRRREFNGAKSLFDHIVWVDRSDHLPKEPPESMELVIDDADIVIDNNGSLEDLSVNVKRFVSEIRE